MSQKKKGKTRRTKRNYRYKLYKYYKKNNLTPIARSMVGFPQNQVVKMRYSNFWEIDMVTQVNGFAENAIRTNSIFSPDVTPNANSHQPLGHDQWANFYENYTVLGSKITITCTLNNTTTNNYIVGVYLTSLPITSAVDPHGLIEQGKCHYSLISPANNGLIINRTLTMKYSAKRWHNVTNVKDDNQQEASFGANLADIVYFQLFVGPANKVAPAAPAVTGVLQYKVDYIVLVKDPLELPQS